MKKLVMLAATPPRSIAIAPPFLHHLKIELFHDMACICTDMSNWAEQPLLMKHSGDYLLEIMVITPSAYM